MLTATRTHDYGKHPVSGLAPFLKKEGFDAVQLVLPKAFQEIDSYEQVTPELIAQIKNSFDENNVKIHILGCYMDLGNPDVEIRAAAVKTFQDCLAYSKLLGASIVGTETAYPRLNKEEKKVWFPHMMNSLNRLVEHAEQLGADMAIEPVYWHPLEDLETTVQVFEKLDSKHLKMIFDPANVLEHPATTDQPAYWNEWLNALGHKIEAIHMKDFTEGANKEYQPVLLGNGVMQYDAILCWLKQHKPDIVIVREELDPASAEKDLCYMRNLWENTPL